MANPRRNKNVQASVTLADLLSRLGGTRPDSPRERIRRKSELEDVGETIPLLETPSKPETGLLEMPSQDVAEPLLTIEEEKEIGENPEKLQKYSRAGNFFARVGGFQPVSPEVLAQATPEKLDIYNTQRLAARNKGIGEMLLMLSDALGGRDVAMRALERQQAKIPKQKSVGQIRSGILNKLMSGQKINREEFNTLVAIDPDYRNLYITNPDLFDFAEEISNESEEPDKQPTPEELVKKYT